MITVDELKEVVSSFCKGKVTERQVAMLQRFFIKEYFKWLPLRTIAEQTGLKNHGCVYDAIAAVGNNPKLYDISLQLRIILELKRLRKPVNLDAFRLAYRKRIPDTIRKVEMTTTIERISQIIK